MTLLRKSPLVESYSQLILRKCLTPLHIPFYWLYLNHLGLVPNLFTFVGKIFKNAESCVMNNGHFTGYFPPERGARQGDSLSAYLFILCVETLFIQIRENEVVKGIRIGDNEIKLFAHGDNSDFLTSGVSSLETIFQTCATFQLYSSLKLNLEKSEACWIGNRMGSDERPINCRWVNIECCAIRTLGIFNSYDKDLEQKLNFLDNVKTLNDVLKLWEFRALTFAGRILVVKSLTLSKLLYACTMKVPGKFVIDQLNTLHENFIWNNRRSKVKHSTLITDSCDVDIENKIAALKIK